MKAPDGKRGLVRFANWLDRCLSTIVLVILTSIVIILVIQIGLRYLLNISFHWSEEMPRYLLVYMVFLGASIAFYRYELIAVTWLPERLRKARAMWMNLIALLVILGFLIWTTRYAIELVIFIFKRGQLTPAMRIPIGYIYLAVPLGFLLMTFFGLTNLVGLFQQIRLHPAKKLKAKPENPT